MERKVARHYRRMLPPNLESLPFQSDNRYQLIIYALPFIDRYVCSQCRSFPPTETVPIADVVTPSWKQKVFEEVQDEGRVKRCYDELCLPQQL